ncbi:hypothetical protein AAY473_001317 [Plecturocebus cupreus]
MPVIPASREVGAGESLDLGDRGCGVREQPGLHGDTLSLLKIQKSAVRGGIHLESQLLGRLRQENGLNLGGRGCKSRSYSVTQAAVQWHNLGFPGSSDPPASASQVAKTTAVCTTMSGLRFYIFCRDRGLTMLTRLVSHSWPQVILQPQLPEKRCTKMQEDVILVEEVDNGKGTGEEVEMRPPYVAQTGLELQGSIQEIYLRNKMYIRETKDNIYLLLFETESCSVSTWSAVAQSCSLHLPDSNDSPASASQKQGFVMLTRLVNSWPQMICPPWPLKAQWLTCVVSVLWRPMWEDSLNPQVPDQVEQQQDLTSTKNLKISWRQGLTLFSRLIYNSWLEGIILPWPAKELRLQIVLLLLPRLEYMARSQLTATSASRVQAILLPQPPENQIQMRRTAGEKQKDYYKHKYRHVHMQSERLDSGRVRWFTPVIPALWEVEDGGSPELDYNIQNY